MHKSPPNPSDKSRLIYTFHMIEGEGARYDEKNWSVFSGGHWVSDCSTLLIQTGFSRQKQCRFRLYSEPASSPACTFTPYHPLCIML